MKLHMLMMSSEVFDFKSPVTQTMNHLCSTLTFVFPAWPNLKKFKKDAPCQAFKNQERHRLKGESSPSQRLKCESSPSPLLLPLAPETVGEGVDEIDKLAELTDEMQLKQEDQDLGYELIAVDVQSA
ncbi:hypothetical protein Tco_0530611 [Tanacetum coccineum]